MWGKKQGLMLIAGREGLDGLSMIRLLRYVLRLTLIYIAILHVQYHFLNLRMFVQPRLE